MKATVALTVVVVLNFTVSSTVAVADDAALHAVAIRVVDTAGLGTVCSVTGGVPIPAGAAPAGSRFLLYDRDHRQVPCQHAVLASWKDGSVRWVLLDFQAQPPAEGASDFQLEWTADGTDLNPSVPVEVRKEDGVSVASGAVELATVEGALLRLSQRLDVRLVWTDKGGQRCMGQVESSDVETAGPLRSTMLLTGSFRTPAGERVVGFRLRASVYAGLPRVCLEPQILIDEYDTPLHMLIQFARTGDPKYFAVAEQAVRHYSEVDVVHSDGRSVDEGND